MQKEFTPPKSEGQRLLRELLTRGHSQKTIAQRCKVTEGYISQLVHGIRGPGLDFANTAQTEYGIGTTLWSMPPREAAKEAGQ